MARRKQQLADKLSEPEGRPGWRDTITSGRPAVEEAGVATKERDAAGLRRKTYLLTADLIERVESLAEAERVGINELARFLLGYAVEEVANGRLKVPTKPARRRIARPE